MKRLLTRLCAATATPWHVPALWEPGSRAIRDGTVQQGRHYLVLQATSQAHNTPGHILHAGTTAQDHLMAIGLLSSACLLAATPAHADESQAAPGNPAGIPVSETAVHPLDYDPVTNEHTAKMTMARSAALDYYQAGKYPQAEAKFIEAIAEARLGFDAKDPHIASCQNNLAEFYRNTGQHDKAEKLYKEALDLLESAFGERHWLYVSAMHNLALSYQAAGNLDLAQETMEKVMHLRLIMFGSRHFLYADSMFALGHILLRQADKQRQAEKQQQQQQQQGGEEPADSGKRRGWRLWGTGGGGGRAGGAKALERRGLQLMEDAVAILEDAESAQVNVILGWLSDLETLYRSMGRTSDALKCARKALYFFTNDKGEAHANASELSDRIIELLIDTGGRREARDVAAACAAARHQVFGREVAVAQSWLRLALLEAQLDKGDVSAANQHARNASVLAGELWTEYGKASAANWLGKQGQDKTVKRARAAYVQASALKFLADHPIVSPGPQATPTQALEQAVSVLESATNSIAQQLQRLSASGGQQDGSGVLDELAGLYVEMQLLLVDCLDALAAQLAVAGPGMQERLQAVKVRHDQLVQSLLEQ